MKAAATPKESMVYHRPFYLDRDDDFWRRVDDCIQQEKLREFEKEEGF